MLNLFSCACWPFAHFLWRNVFYFWLLFNKVIFTNSLYFWVLDPRQNLPFFFIRYLPFQYPLAQLLALNNCYDPSAWVNQILGSQASITMPGSDLSIASQRYDVRQGSKTWLTWLSQYFRWDYFPSWMVLLCEVELTRIAWLISISRTYLTL